MLRIGRVLPGGPYLQTFTKCDVIMTSSAAMNI